MGIAQHWILVALVIVPWTEAGAHDFVVHDVVPGEDWCAVTNAAGPADVISLQPGTYPGGCTVTNGGIAEDNEFLLITTTDPGDTGTWDPEARAVIEVADGGTGMTLTADGVRLYRLEIRGTGTGTGVQGRAIGTIVDTVDLSGLDRGVHVEALGTQPTTVTSSTWIDIDRPIEIGMPTMASTSRPVVRSNVISGWRTAAIVVWSDTVLLSENVIGPGAGSAVLVQGGEVERNVILGGSVGLDAGEAMVRRNVVFGDSVGLLAGPGAALVSNTVGGGGIAGAGGRSEGNAVVGPGAGGSDRPCDADCFVDLAGLDLSPRPGGPLAGRGSVDAGQDLCDRDVDPDHAGALEPPGALPLHVTPLDRLCDVQGSVPPPPDPGLALQERGCGGRAGLWLGFLGLWGRRRSVPRVDPQQRRVRVDLER